MQHTPQSWGRIYWGGGAGKRSEMDTSMGGWRFHCNFCDIGNGLPAFPRRRAADAYLSKHCMDKHSHKTEIRVLMPAAESSTGAADAVNTRGEENA